MNTARRRFLLSSLALLASCSREQASGDAASEFETLELRYQGISGQVEPAELAESLGYLAPLRLKYVGSIFGGPQSVQAAATGDTERQPGPERARSDGRPHERKCSRASSRSSTGVPATKTRRW